MTISQISTSLLVAVLGIVPACRDASFDEFERAGPGSPTLHRALAYGDLDGNGSSDWAAGLAESGSGCPAGKVDVWYSGFDAGHPSESWPPGSTGTDVEPCDASFGAALAIGDFDGDGYGDLAVGAPGDLVSDASNAGSVRILYGSDGGLAATETKRIDQDSAGVADSSELNDAFGTALASGDFNCDAHADLAIGVPGESKNEDEFDVGAVHILFGGPDRLAGAHGQFIQYKLEQDDTGPGNWYFGSFLTAGNIDGDKSGGNGCDDLVVGIPGHDAPNPTGTKVASGSVAVLYGGDHGLDDGEFEIWHQGSFGVPDDSETNDEFGRGVWIVDDNRDGYGDLLAYSHGDDAVFLIYGSSAGLATSGAKSFGTNDSVKGWLRDACVWACEFAWLIAPPGPACDCSGCEILAQTPPDPCPNCG